MLHPLVQAVPPPAATPASVAGGRCNARRDGDSKARDADPTRTGQAATTRVDAPVALADNAPATPPAPQLNEFSAAAAAAAGAAGPVGTPALRPGQPDPKTRDADFAARGVAPARSGLAATPDAAVASGVASPEVNGQAIMSGMDTSAPFALDRANPAAAAAAGTTAAPGGVDADGATPAMWSSRSGGAQHLHVDLHDDALGMVHVEVGPPKDGLSAVLHVDKPELLAALIDGRDQLGRALDAAGVPATHHSINFVASESRDSGSADTGQPGQRGATGQHSGGTGAGGSGSGFSAATGLGTNGQGTASTWQQGGGNQNQASSRPAARGYGDGASGIEEFLPPDVQAVRGRLGVDSIDMIV